MFQYEVKDKSSNLKMFFDEKLSKMFYYTEYTDIDVIFLNESEFTIRDVYLKCSHPVFFGFSWIKIVDEIPPREQIKTKLWFRAVGYLGLQNVKFLSRYRVDSPKPHARMTRAVKEVNIIKSFNFTISTNNSEDDVRERILGVHLKDINKVIDRDLLQYMTINQLAFVKDTGNWSIGVKDITKKKSKYLIEKFFGVEPLEEDYDAPFLSGSGRKRGDSLLLEKGDQAEEIDFSTQHYANFIEHEHKFFKHTMKSLKEYSNKELDKASIAISWRIYKEGICDIKGFQWIFDIILNNQIVSKQSKIDEEEAIDNPLVCLVKHEKIVQFDFSENSFCNVPLNITITNVLKSNSISFCIEAEGNKRVRNINDFFWTGITKKNIKTLKPKEVMNIEFTAWFTTPGVYDLNKIKWTIFKDSATKKILETYEDRKNCRQIEEIPKKLHTKTMVVKIE